MIHKMNNLLTNLLMLSSVLTWTNCAFLDKREANDASSGDYNQEIADKSQGTGYRNIENITVKVGQTAVLPCVVANLGSYKVIWSKDGDILTLGSTKINSDTRLNIQHRHASEWHLVIDNVVTDDEGEYNCKTNGNFFKIIKLQVLMPPAIDDVNSTPAGSITLKEGSSLTLKCYADAKPAPQVKWYRWRKYKHITSEKEELTVVGNEIVIPTIKRNDPNVYECIARNSVPPATSRIFTLESHFLPTVELDVRKTFQFLNKKFSLECKIDSNPIDKAYWLKDGVIFDGGKHKLMHGDAAEDGLSENVRVEQYDLSNINDQFKILLTLNVLNANKKDFGEYQCCAFNIYGQICSDIFVNEIKPESSKSGHHGSLDSLPDYTVHDVDDLKSPVTSTQLGHTRSIKHKKVHKTKSTSTKTMDSLFGEARSSNINEDSSLMFNYDDDGSASGDDAKNGKNSLIEKDKRRHYLSNSKQLLNLESQSVVSGSSNQVASFVCFTLVAMALCAFLN